MNDFFILNNDQFAITSYLTHQYIKRTKNDRFITKGSHPFLYPQKIEKQKRTFIIHSEKTADEKKINFCSSVIIKTLDNKYFTTNPGGEVFSEIVDYESEKKTGKNLMKFRKWILLNKNNIISKKAIGITDKIILKSPFGNYLKISKEGLIANSSLIEDSAVFYFKKAEKMPISNWMIERPFQSNLFLNLKCLDLFSENELFFSQVGFNGDSSNMMKFDNIYEAEQFILGEVIYSLLSQDGKFIKRKFDNKNGDSYYFFDSNEQFDVSFVQMVNRILPLSALHDKIKLFISIFDSNQKGLVCQGFCEGVIDIRKEYFLVLDKIEKEYGEKNLDIQKLWFYLRTPFKLFENLVNLIEEIQKKGTIFIFDIIFKFLTTAIDNELYKLFDFLMQKSIKPYISILGKWINYGILEDIYNEFFVEEFLKENFINFDNNKNLFNDNYWNSKFILHEEKIPQFFQNLGKKIFLTGKYMNVIKVYNPKLTQKKNSSEFFENYSFSIHNEDLRLNIENSYKWANQKLMEIILQKEKFLNKINLLKRFFFMDKGDFFIHFMDLAEDELKKRANSISLEKIQAFLDIALKNSTSNFSILKNKEIFCILTKYNTNELLSAFQHYKNLKNKENLDFENDLNFNTVYDNKKGFENFGINIKISWPLNLILNGKAILKYQILFRYLFILKYSQKQLCNIWLAFQEQRELKKNKFIKFNFGFLQKMLHLSKTLIYHFFFEVIEKKWIDFKKNLKKNVKTFEDIIKFHSEFLEEIFSESFLYNKKFKSLIWNINMFYIFYSDNMKDFLTNFFTLDYKAIIIENNLEEEKITKKNKKSKLSKIFKRNRTQKAMEKHKNKLMNEMIKKHQFPKNIHKFNSKFEQFLGQLRNLLEERKRRGEGTGFLLESLGSEKEFDAGNSFGN